jgi:hypothetical protein
LIRHVLKVRPLRSSKTKIIRVFEIRSIHSLEVLKMAKKMDKKAGKKVGKAGGKKLSPPKGGKTAGDAVKSGIAWSGKGGK